MGPAAFVLRQLRAATGPAVMAFFLVALLAAILAGGPSLVRSLAVKEIRAAASQLSLPERSLTQQTGAPLPYAGQFTGSDPQDRWWGPLEKSLAQIRSKFPERVRAITGPARFLARTGHAQIDTNAGQYQQFLQLDSDPFIKEHFRLAAGRWPQLTQPAANGYPVIEIVLAAAAAERLKWAVGTTRTAVGRKVTLVGSLADQAVDPEFSSIEPNAAQALVFDDGNAPIRLSAVGFVADGAWGFIGGTESSGWDNSTGEVWFPADDAALGGSEIGALVADLRRVQATTSTVTGPSGESIQLRLQGKLADTLTSAAGRAGAAGTVQWVAMSGPFGAAIAVLVLGLQAFARRRRAALELLSDRGAAAGSLRRGSAVQGLIVGLPAAAAGTFAVRWAASWTVPWWAVALGLGAAVVPIAFLAVTAVPRERWERADLSSSSSRPRWVLEVIVLALAGLSMALLSSGSLDSTGGGGGSADVLVVAAPVLSILAVCILTLRLYPLPLLAIRQLTRRRRGLIAHLGVTRSLREPSVGLPLILACLTGVTVATFSVVMLSTIDRGITEAAQRSAGSDLSMQGVPTFPSVLALARSTPGVAAAASLGDAGQVQIQLGGAAKYVELFFGDSADLAKVIGSVPGAPVVPTTMAAGAAEEQPPQVVVSEGLLAAFGTAPAVAGQRVAVVASGRWFPQGGDAWILIDTARVKQLVAGRTTGSTLLMSLRAGTDPSAVQRMLEQKIPRLDGVVPVDFDGLAVGSLQFSTPQQQLAVLRAGPTISGMRIVLISMSALSALLTALAVLVIAVAGARDRGRLLAVLRLLGLRPRQSVGLTAWEQGPPVVTAIVVGGGFGIVLASLLLRAVDLRAFTGDVLRPDLSAPAGLMLEVIGAFAALVLVTVAGSALFSMRDATTTVLRAEA